MKCLDSILRAKKGGMVGPIRLQVLTPLGLYPHLKTEKGGF